MAFRRQVKRLYEVCVNRLPGRALFTPNQEEEFSISLVLCGKQRKAKKL